MTAPVPPVIGVDDEVTSDEFAQITNAILYAQSPPGCSAYDDAGISFVSGDWTVCPLPAELFDDDLVGATRAHDPAFPTRLYFRYTGRVQLRGSIGFASDPTGLRGGQVRRNAGASVANGTAVVQQKLITPNASAKTRWDFPAYEFPVTAGDYIELFGFQSRGTPLASDNAYGADVTGLQIRYTSVQAGTPQGTAGAVDPPISLAAPAITFDDTGLFVVVGADVDEALRAVDGVLADLGTRPTVEQLANFSPVGTPAEGQVVTYNNTTHLWERRTPGQNPLEIVTVENIIGTPSATLVPGAAGVRNTVPTDLASASVNGPYTRPVWLTWQFTARKTATGDGNLWVVITETTSPAPPSGLLPVKYIPYAVPNPSAITADKTSDFTILGRFRLGTVTDSVTRTFKLSAALSGTSATAPQCTIRNASDGAGTAFAPELH